MSGPLGFIKSEAGFFLPYTFVIALITMLVVMTGVEIYKNEMMLSNRMIDQLEIETLIQLGRDRLLQEVPLSHFKENKITYTFPSGTSEIEFVKIEEGNINIFLKIRTINDIEHITIGHVKEAEFVLH